MARNIFVFLSTIIFCYILYIVGFWFNGSPEVSAIQTKERFLEFPLEVLPRILPADKEIIEQFGRFTNDDMLSVGYSAHLLILGGFETKMSLTDGKSFRVLSVLTNSNDWSQVSNFPFPVEK